MGCLTEVCWNAFCVSLAFHHHHLETFECGIGDVIIDSQIQCIPDLIIQHLYDNIAVFCKKIKSRVYYVKYSYLK